jgi:DHA1 family bicyclomycin/chloramphenicol resistance-like MFS transporter
MYLPSLPTLAAEFGATPGQVQLTLSAFFIGFAIGQLVYGPLSDRYGPKPVLLVGLGAYGLTSLLCAASPSIEVMTGLRFLQALGGGAGTVIARAMVRDLYPRDRAAQVLSMLMLVTALAPLGAPLIGGYLLHWSGWRMIFGLLALFGLICFAAIVWHVPESHPATHRSRSRLTQLISAYGTVLGHRQALGAIRKSVSNTKRSRPWVSPGSIGSWARWIKRASMLQDGGFLIRFFQSSWPSKKTDVRQKFRPF